MRPGERWENVPLDFISNRGEVQLLATQAHPTSHHDDPRRQQVQNLGNGISEPSRFVPHRPARERRRRLPGGAMTSPDYSERSATGTKSLQWDSSRLCRDRNRILPLR